jgi:hypothetical protein
LAPPGWQPGLRWVRRLARSPQKSLCHHPWRKRRRYPEARELRGHPPANRAPCHRPCACRQPRHCLARLACLACRYRGLVQSQERHLPANRAPCHPPACRLAMNCLARLACRYRGLVQSRERRLPASRAPCHPPACPELMPYPAAKGFPQCLAGLAPQKARSLARLRRPQPFHRRGSNYLKNRPRDGFRYKIISRHQALMTNQ